LSTPFGQLPPRVVAFRLAKKHPCASLCLTRYVPAVKTCGCPTIGREWSQSGQFVPPGFEWVLCNCPITEAPFGKRENAMALEIVTIFLAGAALGLRFKVMILVPALILIALFAAIVGLSSGDQFWSIAAAMILLGTAIQVGYLAGILFRAKIASVRERRTAVTM
jgi:hypothetical protein